MSKILLEEMSWCEVEEALRRTDVILVPIGSIEQHGPHLPLNTDTIVPFEFAKRVADKIGALVAPPIRPGVSSHHMPKPGTIAIEPSTLIALVKDYCRCLFKHGFKRIFLLNGHGGNSNTVGVAVQELHDELPEAQIAYFDWWVFIPKEMGELMSPSEGIHANKAETAWMLAVAPDLVNMSKAVDELPPFVKDGMSEEEFRVYMAAVRTIDDLSKSGCVGKATEATKEFGEECLNKAVERGAKFFEALMKT